MELIRYVHNNPVRAGVVERASESDWSSHRAYLGLAPTPDWLATDAVFGADEKARETIRHDLACFVDEGRGEPRRPEFSGEVSSKLAKRVRKLMGGDVSLSYPVLGPDKFLVEALRQQASKHQAGNKMQTTAMGVEPIVKGIFEELGLDPGLATKRVKPKEVARGRGLVAWMWVEIMGRPQVSVAEGLNLRPASVSKMLTRLRRDGLSAGDERILKRVFKSLISSASRAKSKKTKSQDSSKNSIAEPKILVLKRKR